MSRGTADLFLAFRSQAIDELVYGLAARGVSMEDRLHRPAVYGLGWAATSSWRRGKVWP